MDARRQALGQFETSVNQAREDELARQQFNLGQQGKEKYGQLSTELGFASLGVADRGALMQKRIGEAQASAAVNAANSNSGKK
jgi:hypothetical protein